MAMNDIYGNDEKLNLNRDNAQDVGEDISQNENRDREQNDALENEPTNPGKSKGVFVWLGIFASSLTAMLLMIGLEKILKLYDISYRSWLEQLICGILIFLVPIFFFILLEVILEQWKKVVSKKIVYFISNVLQILVIGIGGFYIPVAGFFYLLTYESTFETEHMIKDAKGNTYIEGVTAQFLGGSDEDEYAYYMPLTFLMKKRYTDETNILGMKLERMHEESFTVQNVDGTFDSAEKTGTASGMDREAIDASSDPNTPEGAYVLLYNAIFKDHGDAYQPTYNAKGNFYAVLGVGSEEVDGETQNYRRTVVYDRESKNGECLLFVAYKEYTYFDGSAGNTAILNFYGVDKKTGEVIAADKTAWADVGCKAYRDMTGE